jgi:hypothetical protein
VKLWKQCILECLKQRYREFNEFVYKKYGSEFEDILR